MCQNHKQDGPERRVIATAIGAVAVLTAAAIIATRAIAVPEPIPNRYKVQIDVQVKDPKALCQEAHKIALEEFGVHIAEMVTTTRGEYVTWKCVGVIYQTAALSDQLVSTGMYIKEAE